MGKNQKTGENGTGPLDASKYRSVKVMARTKQRLDLLAAAYQVPLTQLIEEMTDEWWERVVKKEGGIAPDCAMSHPLPSHESKHK